MAMNASREYSVIAAGDGAKAALAAFDYLIRTPAA